MATPTLPTVPTVTKSGDPFAGATLAGNPYVAQAITPGAPLIPSFEQARANPPAAVPEPVADPFAGAIPTTVADPFEGATPAGDMRGYDMDKLRSTKIEDLLKDKTEFNPVEFYAKNTDALLADPTALQKVEQAFEEREKERMGVGGLAKAIATAPLHPIETAKTVGKAAAGGVEFLKTLASGVGQVFETGGQVAGHLSEGDLPAAAKGLSEAIGAADTAQQRWVTIVTDKVGPALGVVPRGKTARERLAFDADFKRAEINAGKGNGELAKVLGTDQDGLKAAGVQLDPNAIEKLSIITDPVNLVPIGGVVGVVGRSGKFILGKAVSPAAAELFAKTVNGAMEKAAAWPVAKGGAAVEKIGETVATKGPALVRSGAARGYGAIHAAMSGDISPLVAALAAPTVAKVGGQAIAATGRGIQAAAPAVGRVVSEGVKGAAEGAVIATPLFLGSTEEEREGLGGMIAGAGFLRAGLAGAGVAKNVAERGEQAVGRAVQNQLAKKVFETVDQGPVVDSPAYGTDTKLDIAHQEHLPNLPKGEQALLSQAREFFRDAGVEFYGVDQNTFVNNVPNVAGSSAAEGFYVKRGEQLLPDGTTKPVIQILLNKDTNGLGHELYHAFKSLDPQASKALESHIAKTWTPEEKAWLSDTYNSALNGGKPKEQWVAHLNENQILEEAAAEVFGRIVNASDLSGVRPSIVKRGATFASSVLDKMGYSLGGKALPQGPGVSALGIRPSTAEARVAQDFLGDMTKRAKEGRLGTATPGNPLEAAPSGPISRRPAAEPTPTPQIPAAAAPAAPSAKPAPAPAPAAPAPQAPNIRVTPKEQADFASERAAVTNTDQAAAAAVKADKVPQVTAINDAMNAGHAVEIVHKGVIREGGPSPEKPVARGERRAEQEAAYIAEAMGAVPDSVREPHQKLFFGTRWIKGGKQLTARSVDKALANIKNAVDMAADKKVALPYEVDASGKLTEAGWTEAVQDLKDYWSNQDRGFRGDGQALAPETRTRDVGQSIPPQDPAGPAAIISPERMDFLNLVQGLNIPATVKGQQAGKVPGNIKGQILAEIQGKRPATPAGFTAADVQKATFKPIEGELAARSIMEVNPLRNDLRAKGAPVENLIEVTENIKQENIESVTPRPDVTGRGGSTDITRAGFSVKNVADAAKILDQSPQEWTDTIKTTMGGKLTPAAYRLGLSLTDRADLAKLATMRDKAEAQGKEFMAKGDFEAAMPTIMKAQFFREAWEAAQGTGSARRGLKLVDEFKDAVPPFSEPQQSFSVAADFEKSLDPVKMAAIRTKGGNIYTGSWHGEAYLNMADAVGRGEGPKEALPEGFKSLTELLDSVMGGEKIDFIEDGFVTESGKFLNRQEAFEHGKRIGQLKEGYGEKTRGGNMEKEGMLESDEFNRGKSFSPVAKPSPEIRDVAAKAAAERAPKTGPTKIQQARAMGGGEESFSPSVPTDKEVTAALSEDKKPFVGAHRDLEPGTPVGLRIDIPAFTRNGTYVVTVHEKAKGGAVGKRIGYDSVATVDNPTFFSNEKGALQIKEGRAKFPIATVEGEFNPSREVPEAGGEWTEVGYNPTRHSYFFEKGTEEPVVSGSQAVSAGNSVFVKDAVFGNKEDFAFSAAPEERVAKPATGAHVTQKKVAGTPEFNAYVQNKIEKSQNFPEAFPLEFRQDKDGNYEAQWDGEPLPKAKPYNLLKSDLAQKLGDEDAFASALADKLEREYQKAKENPVISEGEFWYSTFRDKVGKVLGDDTKLFAELLGATSPQQAVGPNFKDALGAYNQYKSGAYDAMLAKYQEGKHKFAAGDIAEFTEETGKTGKKATKEAFLNWWQKKHDLIPKKANGKKFGMNSRAVLKVLDGSWLEGVQGPKTPNFTGNLAGTTFKATIDVWAMRALSRLANEESGKPWRIQNANESGVADPEFFFGQKAFQQAADNLGIKADALQAILWFAEKDLWEKNGWTGAAGKAKSDYNTLLDRTVKSPEGQLIFTPEEVKPKAKKPKAQLELDIKPKKYAA